MSKMGHLKILYIFRTALPTIHTENTDQLCSGLWLIEADGRCGQMSVEYDQVRLLAATGISATWNAASFACVGTIHTCAHSWWC